jgi:hypothetical protein
MVPYAEEKLPDELGQLNSCHHYNTQETDWMKATELVQHLRMLNVKQKRHEPYSPNEHEASLFCIYGPQRMVHFY